MSKRNTYAQKSWTKFNAWQTAHKSEIVNPYNEAQYINEYEILADENLHMPKNSRMNILKTMQSYAKYNMSQKTALSAYAAYKEQFPNGDLKLADIRRMSTTEFAELVDAGEYYKTLIAAGYSSRQAKMMVSATYFGS